METPSSSASPGYEHSRVTKPSQWHGTVAADVCLNNLATGLFLVAATADLAVPSALAGLASIAYPIALVALLADLICLVLDLGDPWRFHHMLRIVKPSSPMSLGVWSLTLFSFPLTALVLLDLLPSAWGVPRWLHVVCVLLALLPAFGSVAYKGVLFSTSVQPGWREARWLGAYLVSSALALGCAVLLALALWLAPQRVTMLRFATGSLLLLGALPLGMLAIDIRSVLPRLFDRAKLTGLAAVAFGGEIALPLVLLLLSETKAAVLSAVVCFMFCAVLLRIVLVLLPHAE